MMASGLVFLLGGRLLDGKLQITGLFGMFLVVYAGVIVAGNLQDRFLADRLDKLLDRWGRDKSGKGIYGMVALAVWAWLECDSLFDFSLSSIEGAIVGKLMASVVGFSLDAFRNMVRATIWPLWLVNQFGVPLAAVFGVLCWLVFEAGRTHLPPLENAVASSEPESAAAGKPDGDA